MKVCTNEQNKDKIIYVHLEERENVQSEKY